MSSRTEAEHEGVEVDLVADPQGPTYADDDDFTEDDEEPQTADDVADDVLAEAEGEDAEGPTDSEELAHVLEWQADVLQAEAVVAEKAEKLEAAKSVASAAKKAYDTAVDDLRATIKTLGQPTLFDRTANAEKPSGGDVPVRTPVRDGDEVGIRAEFGDDWEAVPVERLVAHGLAAGVVELLVDAELTTIGKIAAWTKSGKLLIDIDGVGDAKSDAIDNALALFWAEWGPVDDGEGGDS